MTPDMINRIVQFEGWTLHDVGGLGLYQIQRVDSPPQMRHDGDAYNHVRDCADTGSWVHKHALEIHRAYAPLITAHTARILKGNP